MEEKEAKKKRQQKQYDESYKKEAVKLAKEQGVTVAAEQLNISKSTLYEWIKAAGKGNIDLGVGELDPKEVRSIAAELKELKQQLKEKDKEIKRLKKENEFLEEASAFFAASRLK